MPTREELKVGQEERIRSYYQAISAKGKEVMREKRAQGEIMHKAPLGYKNARDEHGRSILEIDPETYPLVQKAKELRTQGMSIRKICSTLNEQGKLENSSRNISSMALWRALSHGALKEDLYVLRN